MVSIGVRRLMCCAFVLALFLPVPYIASNGAQASWMSNSWAGTPAFIWVSGLHLLSFILLAWVFAKDRVVLDGEG